MRRTMSSADCVQIGKRGCDFEAVQILGKTLVADLLETEHSLDHANRVLKLHSNARLVAVHGLDLLVDSAAPSMTLVGEVPRAWRRRQLRPRNNPLCQEPRSARALAVLPNAAQCLLLRRGTRVKTTNVSDSTGKSELAKIALQSARSRNYPYHVPPSSGATFKFRVGPK